MCVVSKQGYHLSKPKNKQVEKKCFCRKFNEQIFFKFKAKIFVLKVHNLSNFSNNQTNKSKNK